MSLDIPAGLLTDVASVPTPALVADAAAMRLNQKIAVGSLRPGQRLRPHFKAHKCTGLLPFQLDPSNPIACCQTSWEAVVLADVGVRDVMVTNQVVDAAALAELAQAARRATVSVLVDDPAHVRLLEVAASRAGVTFEVLVEVELGMKRWGVPADSAALLELARAITAAPSLRFIGVQAYDGHVAGIADPAARRAAAARSAALTRLAVKRLREAGFAALVVAGCATSHLPFMEEMEVWTDVQAGSYLLMDGAYADCPDLTFGSALFALATVIHRSEDRIVLDLGLKQLAVDRGQPAWVDDPEATLRLSDEHTAIALRAPSALAIGDRTLLRPRHVDPTVNLHPLIWLREAGAVRALAVDGRMPAGRSG